MKKSVPSLPLKKHTTIINLATVHLKLLVAVKLILGYFRSIMDSIPHQHF
jgi:hypothetical protein